MEHLASEDRDSCSQCMLASSDASAAGSGDGAVAIAIALSWLLAMHIMPVQLDAPLQALAHSGAQRSVIARRHATAWSLLATASRAMEAKFMKLCRA